MIIKNNKFLLLLYRYLNQIFDIQRIIYLFPSYYRYFKTLLKYKKLEHIEFINTFPIIFENSIVTKIDPHYYYQSYWAFKHIHANNPKLHIDVASQLDLSRYLSVLHNVIFIDIRPINVNIEKLQCKKGSILQLPFNNRSCLSISTLHVIEHIGLGRYGDDLDAAGHIKAARELTRVLDINGTLYLSTLIGKPKVCFNAHRIFSPSYVVELFSDLMLVNFSVIDDLGRFIENTTPNDYENAEYSCGLFIFKKDY